MRSLTNAVTLSQQAIFLSKLVLNLQFIVTNNIQFAVFSQYLNKQKVLRKPEEILNTIVTMN